MKESLLEKYPQLMWCEYTPVNDDQSLAGTKAAFGKPMNVHLALDQAKVIVTLDADPLGQGGNSVENCRAFALSRDADHKSMSRMYAVESAYSPTGAAADHRLAVQSGKIAAFTQSLVAGVKAVMDGGQVDAGDSHQDKVMAAMVSDLVAHKGHGVVIAGGGPTGVRSRNGCPVEQLVGQQYRSEIHGCGGSVVLRGTGFGVGGRVWSGADLDVACPWWQPGF